MNDKILCSFLTCQITIKHIKIEQSDSNKRPNIIPTLV